jgi:hypothetical protein
MPLETAAFISQLDPANPAQTDPIQQGYSHIQLVKQVLQDQFPNLGTVAVTGTATALNAASGTALNAGTIEIASNGTIAGAELLLDGILGTGTVAAAGKAAILNSGTAGGPGNLSFQITNAAGTIVNAGTVDGLGNWSLPGTLGASTVLQGGVPVVPPGCIMLWSGAVGAIPSGWHLCDGTNGTPDLRNKFVVGAGSTYAVAQTGGAVSQTASTDNQGAHAHSGATGAGGAFTPSGSTDTAGSHSHTGNTGGHALTIAELAAHNHQEGAGLLPGSGGETTWTTQSGGAHTSFGAFTENTGSGAQHSHPISADGSHAHNLVMNAAPAHTHSVSVDGTHMHSVTVATLPPFYALCYIMKL